MSSKGFLFQNVRQNSKIPNVYCIQSWICLWTVFILVYMQAKYKPTCLKHTSYKGYPPRHEVHLSLLCHISFSTHGSI